MIYLEATNLEELEEELKDADVELALGVEITKQVCKALEENVDKINLSLFSKVQMDLTISKTGFLESLEKNLERCERAEEYELCEKSLKWINHLKKENS